MLDSKPSPAAAVPSPRRLLRSTAIAALVAAVLLVTVVLPAEHGVDPTGVGRLLGLTRMGEIKVSLAKEAAAVEQVAVAVPSPPTPTPPTTAPTAEPAAPPAGTSDPASPLESRPPEAPAPVPPPAVQPATAHVTEVVLTPNQGKEIKLVMRKGARVTYSWSTNHGVVNYDLHADAPGIDYHGYVKGMGKASDEGVLEAAFDGRHGWFWRNRGTETLTVTLRTNGDYQELVQ